MGGAEDLGPEMVLMKETTLTRYGERSINTFLLESIIKTENWEAPLE